jgi:hypothetical protein
LLRPGREHGTTTDHLITFRESIQTLKSESKWKYYCRNRLKTGNGKRIDKATKSRNRDAKSLVNPLNSTSNSTLRKVKSMILVEKWS